MLWSWTYLKSDNPCEGGLVETRQIYILELDKHIAHETDPNWHCTDTLKNMLKSRLRSHRGETARWRTAVLAI